MIHRIIPCAALVLVSIAFAQSFAESIPAGTPLVVTTQRAYPMRDGVTVRAELLYPVYSGNQVSLPRGTTVIGRVIALQSDHAHRVRAALGGDFTPFHAPELLFTELILPDGSKIPLASKTVTDGYVIYRATAPMPVKGGFLRRELNAGVTAIQRDIQTFTAPGKSDRLLQFVYNRLPYHPQRIAAGTSWTIETTDRMTVSGQPPVGLQTAQPITGHGAWVLQANLVEPLSSERSHSGDKIQAVVAEPIYSQEGHRLLVPQDTTLTGTVTRAKPARSFGRSGVLSFNFTQLMLPDQEATTIETRLTGADSAAEIALSSEGQVKSKPRDKVTIPLALALMASRPLDLDSGRASGTVGKNAAGGAASLSLIGTIVAIVGGSPYVAAGIGYWGAARAFYERWLAHGQKIVFPRDTRIVVETTPRRSQPLKPSN
ncbi:MAG TPA: hypothetical protein VG714_04455 [Acidobacteriaceae bacterium]|nr:hypothetical protein [Acidobacteriaceae bacterium]